MKHSCSISLRLPLEFLEKFESSVKQGKFPNVSEALRSYAKLGMHVESFKTMIKDPEFLKSIDELKQTEGIFQWIETLTDAQADAIKTALEMDKERRTRNITVR